MNPIDTRAHLLSSRGGSATRVRLVAHVRRLYKKQHKNLLSWTKEKYVFENKTGIVSSSSSGIRHHYTVAHPFTHTRTVERKPNKNVFNGIMDQAMSTPLYCVQLRTIVPDNCLEMCTPASNSQQSLEHRAPRTRFGIFTGKCVTWRCDAFAAGDSFYQLRVIFVRPIFLCMCRMRRWEANSSLLLFFVSFFSSFICCLECSYATIHDLRSICWIRRVIRFQVAKSRDEHTHTRNFINKRNLILLFRSVRWAISSSLVSTVEARTRHELSNNKINVSSTKLIIWCK